MRTWISAFPGKARIGNLGLALQWPGAETPSAAGDWLEFFSFPHPHRSLTPGPLNSAMTFSGFGLALGDLRVYSQSPDGANVLVQSQL